MLLVFVELWHCNEVLGILCSEVLGLSVLYGGALCRVVYCDVLGVDGKCCGLCHVVWLENMCCIGDVADGMGIVHAGYTLCVWRNM